MIENKNPRRRTLRAAVAEWFLNLCGYKICPATHNDPTIHGPQPRILTKKQVNELESMEETR